jgi:hypothetical protein
MAIFQSDMMIKMAIELGLEDIKNNPWLIDDMLSDAATNVYLKDKYGQKQIDACKEWLKNNQIEISMVDREDRDRYPLITITLGTSNEKNEMKTLDEQSTETIKLLPQDINKPIPFVIKPTAIDSYDPSTGEVLFPAGTKGFNAVAPGMILVDPVTGNGYVIEDKTADGLIIQDSLALTAAKYAVVPQFQFYEARVGHTFFQETYNIGCHVMGDPQTLLWLHSIVLYSLMRYREGLFEANGFAESTLSSSDLLPNPNLSGPGGEKAYSRFISLTGQVENTWIKAPRRRLESAVLGDGASNGFKGGIHILSNFDSRPDLATPNEAWDTVEDETE